MFNGFLRPVPSGVRNIKSIQRGSFSYYNLATLDVTINSVDTTKSIVYVSYKGGYGRADTDLIAAKISDATTVNFSSGKAWAYAVTVSWIVIEFDSCVKSLQTGSVVASAATTDVAITTVGVLKSFSVVSKKSTSTSTTNGYYKFTHHITSATNLAITGQNANTETYEWQVIEFK